MRLSVQTIIVRRFCTKGVNNSQQTTEILKIMIFHKFKLLKYSETLTEDKQKTLIVSVIIVLYINTIGYKSIFYTNILSELPPFNN